MMLLWQVDILKRLQRRPETLRLHEVIEVDSYLDYKDLSSKAFFWHFCTAEDCQKREHFDMI